MVVSDPRAIASITGGVFIYSASTGFFLVVCQYIDMICLKMFSQKKTHVTNSRQNKEYPTTWRRHMWKPMRLFFYNLRKACDFPPFVRVLTVFFSISQDGEKNNFL